MAEDILFSQKDFIFSYRVGAVLYRDGEILLQRSLGDEGYALPGGQVAFGEFSQKALARELMEETGAAIQIGRLCAVAEVFFQWQKPCHQINLYYLAELKNSDALPKGSFYAYDSLGRERRDLEFSWISLDALDRIKVYPRCIKPYLKEMPDSVVHLQQNMEG